MKKRIVTPRLSATSFFLILISLILVLGLALILLPRNQAPASNPQYQKLKKQLGQLKEAYQKNPRDLTAATNYAFALYATRNNQTAIKVYNQVAKLNKNDARALNNLGNLYHKSGRYERAIDAYRRSIKADSKQINAYVNLANLYIRDLDQLQKGKAVFQKVLQKNPQNLALRQVYESLVK